MTISRVLILTSVICFVFAAFGFNPGGLGLIPLGLALFASGHLT
jgi:hypothetical protein